MTTFGHQLPNVFYYRALQQAALSGLENIYAEFRQPVMRAVSLEGGTSADAAVFFQTALQETAHLYRDADFSNPETENNLPPFFQQIKALALAHYRDWREERREAAFQQEPDPNADSRSSTASEMSAHNDSFPNYIKQESSDKYAFVWGQVGEHTPPSEERASPPPHSIHSEEDDGRGQDASESASPLSNHAEEQGDSFKAILPSEKNAEEQDDHASDLAPLLRDNRGEQDDTPDTAPLPGDQEENHAATDHRADRSSKEEVKESEPTILIPPFEALQLTRRKIFFWKKFSLLPEKTKNALSQQTTLENTDLPHTELQALRSVLQWTGDEALPAWALTALQDHRGYALWQQMQIIEKRISAGQPILPVPKRRDRTEYIARFVFAALLLALLAWIFFPRGSKEAKRAYKDVFAPPASIMEDVEKRYGPDLAFDSVTVRPSDCTELLKAADKEYARKNYAEALPVLAELYENGDDLCQSDALFYMGLVFLQLDAPGKTIACFAKIEDLEHYGEDLYWYQALAFVKRAERDPDGIKVAKKALKQAIANTQDPERRNQAQKMLLSFEKEVSHE